MMSIEHPPVLVTPGNMDSALAAFWARVRVWFRACADYYAAAAMYEQLSGLSNAELERRGLSRETLARDIVSACERPDQH
jgi:hypothetical protein